MKIGYARISTSGQDTFHQELALKNAGCEKIFFDQMSGAVYERPGLSELLEFVRPQDTVVVYRLDRLARSLQNLITTVNLLSEKGASLCSLHENIDTTTPGGKLVFHLFGALGEFERGILRERTLSGLEAAKHRGKFGGRPIKLKGNEVQMIKKLYDNKEISPFEICRQFSISKSTFYRAISGLGQSCK